jgi:hypothetical protein
MSIFDFLKRKTDNKSKNSDSVPERENSSSSASKTYMELDEFLYLANKMVINNQASTDTAHVKAFIKDEISETELNVVKEEIKYFMFCLLHFSIYQEIAVNEKILNLNDKKAKIHFIKITHNSLERSFLFSSNDFDYTLEKYKNRYEKYIYYLEKYKYQDIERSFVECFAAQVTGMFEDNPNGLNIDVTQLLLTARWVYRIYGESTKDTLSKLNLIA